MSATAIELPLFPLDVVLFPGIAMPLHIFEPRYRQMIAECHEHNKPFGIVLAQPDSVPLHEEPYPIGVMAEIRDLEQLEDGRYIVLAMGVQRFRILSQHRRKPYLSGIVEPFNDRPTEPSEDLTASTRQAGNLFNTYLQTLLESAEVQPPRFNIPSEPEELSFVIAYLLDIEDEQKQRFLELDSTQDRLQQEIIILRHEVPFMQQMLTHHADEEHSRLN